MQVRKKDTQRIYALKTIRKANIASRPGEITHILAERTVLALVNNPFIVPLKFSFQNPDKLYLVMSFGAFRQDIKVISVSFDAFPSERGGAVLSLTA
jgi:serine/threonine protein kinase